MKDIIKISSLKPFIDVEGIEADTEVQRKRFSSKITIDDTEDKTCVANITTTDEDAEGDVIIPSGADLKRFMKNPVVMYAHNYSGKPVAKAVALSITEDGIAAKMKFADTEEANDVWSLIKGGFLNANSIGFIAKEGVRRGTEEFDKYIKEKKMKVKDTVQRIITKFELLESSIVPIPCNPEALMVAVSSKSITLSDKTMKELDLPKVVVVKEEPKVEEPKVEEPKIIEEVKEVKEVKEEPKVIEVKSPACRKEDETEKDCVARKIPEIMAEGMSQEQAVAMAYSMCKTSCAEKSKEFNKSIEEAKPRYIKVLRHGGYDLKKLAELHKLAKIGRII